MTTTPYTVPTHPMISINGVPIQVGDKVRYCPDPNNPPSMPEVWNSERHGIVLGCARTDAGEWARKKFPEEPPYHESVHVMAFEDDPVTTRPGRWRADEFYCKPTSLFVYAISAYREIP